MFHSVILTSLTDAVQSIKSVDSWWRHESSASLLTFILKQVWLPCHCFPVQTNKVSIYIHVCPDLSYMEWHRVTWHSENPPKLSINKIKVPLATTMLQLCMLLQPRPLVGRCSIAQSKSDQWPWSLTSDHSSLHPIGHLSQIRRNKVKVILRCYIYSSRTSEQRENIQTPRRRWHGGSWWVQLISWNSCSISSLSNKRQEREHLLWLVYAVD